MSAATTATLATATTAITAAKTAATTVAIAVITTRQHDRGRSRGAAPLRRVKQRQKVTRRRSEKEEQKRHRERERKTRQTLHLNACLTGQKVGIMWHLSLLRCALIMTSATCCRSVKFMHNLNECVGVLVCQCVCAVSVVYAHVFWH